MTTSIAICQFPHLFGAYIDDEQTLNFRQLFKLCPVTREIFVCQEMMNSKMNWHCNTNILNINSIESDMKCDYAH